MNKLILGSVGDGMFLGLLNYSNARCNYLQIDCASKEEAYVARSYSILKEFLLIHFHFFYHIFIMTIILGLSKLTRNMISSTLVRFIFLKYLKL